MLRAQSHSRSEIERGCWAVFHLQCTHREPSTVTDGFLGLTYLEEDGILALIDAQVERESVARIEIDSPFIRVSPLYRWPQASKFIEVIETERGNQAGESGTAENWRGSHEGDSLFGSDPGADPEILLRIDYGQAFSLQAWR